MRLCWCSLICGNSKSFQTRTLFKNHTNRFLSFSFVLLLDSPLSPLSLAIAAVGDKSCDVYKYDLETGEGTLLFGHISMLLAMKVCPREKFIVTCDRDEKVRVTNYPSVYNIQTYLLGHREFVSSCAFIDDQHVLTGSGDSQIKLWNIIDGKELCSVDLSVDLAAKLAVNGGHPAKERDGGGTVDDRNEPASNEPAKNESDRPAGSESTNEAAKADDRLAIKRVFCIRSSLIVVAFFNLPNLVTFVIEPGLQLVRNAIIELPSNLLDAIEHGDRLYLLTAADGLISYEAQGNQLVRLDGDRFLASINANQELFKFNEKELTSFRLLYKLPSGSDEAEPNDDRDARKRKRSN